MMDNPSPFHPDAATETDRLRVALQSAGVGTWDLDIVNQQIWWDERCKELYGFDQQDVVPYAQVETYVHAEDRQAVDQAVQWALDPQSGGHYDVRFRTVGAEDGRLRWLHSQGRAYFDDQGVAYRFTGIAQDITLPVTNRQQQDQLRHQLHQSEGRFRQLVEEAPVATCLFVGRQMQIELANEIMLRFWGKDTSVLGKPLAEAVPELVGQPFLAILDHVFTSGQTYVANGMRADLEVNGVLTTYYFDFTYKPLRDEAGRVYAIMDMAVDVTEQVLARQQVEESEASLRGAIELAQLGTWEMDLTTGLIEYSQRLRAWHGLQPGEIITRERAYQFVRKPDWPQVREAIAQAATPGGSGVYDVEYVIEANPTGPERILHAQGKAYFNEDGQAYKISGTVQDVTQERQIQLALEQQVQERTEQLRGYILDLQRSNDNLQQFAYVASHDLQEPLRKIQQFGDLLQARFGDSSGEELDYLERIRSAASRMSTLIKDLLAFSRISTRQEAKAPVALTEVVRAALTELELIIHETNAQVTIEPLPTVMGDASQLRQLFQNLLSNALKFRHPEQAPVIGVSCQVIVADDLPAAITTTRPAASYYRLDVADNGIGFEEKYLDRIFQVFQRLHGRSQYAGTGIGLAICEKVAANHGGAITASSRPGQGATFSVYLPI